MPLVKIIPTFNRGGKKNGKRPGCSRGGGGRKTSRSSLKREADSKLNQEKRWAIGGSIAWGKKKDPSSRGVNLTKTKAKSSQKKKRGDEKRREKYHDGKKRCSRIEGKKDQLNTQTPSKIKTLSEWGQNRKKKNPRGTQTRRSSESTRKKKMTPHGREEGKKSTQKT